MAKYTLILRCGEAGCQIAHKFNIESPKDDEFDQVAHALKSQFDEFTVKQIAGWVREIESYRSGDEDE